MNTPLLQLHLFCSFVERAYMSYRAIQYSPYFILRYILKLDIFPPEDTFSRSVVPNFSRNLGGCNLGRPLLWEACFQIGIAWGKG